MNKLIHTPEGVKDIYGRDYFRASRTLFRISDELESFGFMRITTPSFEYFDIFSGKVGIGKERELYKFFDKENNTLVLRPDFTPGIARVYSKYFADSKVPVRLTYRGNVFKNLEGLQGKMKESYQIGAELIGDPSCAADAEVIAANIKCILAGGLRDFRLTLGHPGFIMGILKEADLDDDTMDALAEEITVKNCFAIVDILRDLDIPEEKKRLITNLPFLMGSPELLEKAKGMVDNEESLAAIERLREIYDLLGTYNMQKYISFDLGMYSKLRYYTGVIFKAYADGAGEPVTTGGRYDSLIKKFGCDAPAVGFVLCMETFMQALNSKDSRIEETTKGAILIYEEDSLKEAIAFAEEKRSEGGIIELIPRVPGLEIKDHIMDAKQMVINEAYVASKGKIEKAL